MGDDFVKPLLPFIVFGALMIGIIVFLNRKGQREVLSDRVRRKVAEEAASLNTGAQIIKVESLPLPNLDPLNFETDRAAEKLLIRLRHRDRRRSHTFGWLLVAIGLIGIAWTVAWVLTLPSGEMNGWYFFALIPSVLSIYAGLPLLYLPEFYFDRKRGFMIYRATWSWLQPPLRLIGLELRKILGVQVLYAGDYTTNRGERLAIYQLNLIMRDALQKRVNLTVENQGEVVLKRGQELAEFLKVPLIKQVPPPASDPDKPVAAPW